MIAAGGGTAMVFGHSSGCVLALEAAHAGLPITHLALYEAPLVIDSTRHAVGKQWAQVCSPPATTDEPSGGSWSTSQPRRDSSPCSCR